MRHPKPCKIIFTLALVIFTCTFSIAQGVTTSSMNGKILDTTGESLIGANITAVHQPSGSFYGTTTDLNGLYRIAGMRVGGPYKVTVTYAGYQEQTYDNVFLRLGEPFDLNVILSPGTIDLGEVVVTASASSTGETSGAATQITTEDIDLMPTLNRGLNDFTRLTPQAKATANGGFSIAGMNNRYNAIYIDGAVNNDVFGLAANGTNGGQTGIAPISIDVIDQIQVVISPYDVTLGGFAGGGINAVTKSGTNQLSGTAYYFTQSESLAGKTNKALLERTSGEAEKLDDFSQKTYGLSLGGPIVKNKVFFFVNAELQDDQTPTPFDFNLYEGNASQTQLENLSNTLINDYGYDPGGFLGKTNKLEGTRLFAKLDVNFNESHKLSLRHQYTKAKQFNVNGSSRTTINFENNGVFFPSTTNSFAAELNSQFGIAAFNNLIIGITTVRDDRDPLGSNFPYLIIEDGDRELIQLGSEQFSTANELNQNIFTLTNNFKFYAGNQTITIGTHNEFSSFYNLFIRQNFGVYRFDSIDSFLSGLPATEYDRSYSLVDNITGDGSAAAAEFDAMQLGFYIQDEWQIDPKFALTAGLRVDIPVLLTDPTEVSSFNRATLPLIQQSYDLQGARAGKMSTGQWMLSPRMGFKYTINDARTSILRGGLGVFTSRIPFVWPGGAYVNNGLTIGGLNENNIAGDINFIPEVDRQYTNPDFTIPSGQMDLFVEDFRYPQIFRTNLAIDYLLPGGISATLEGLYSQTLNNVNYTNVNSDPSIDFRWTNGPIDNRPIFTRTSIDPSYSAIYLASNTSNGYTFNITASLAKDFTNGLNAFIAYTYGQAKAENEGTSSQNSSQWRGSFHVDGRNSAGLGISDFSLGSRLISGLSYTLNWNASGNTASTFSLFYEGHSGSPYSYVYGGSSARNLNNETGSTSRNRSLIYIPASQNEINLVDPSQWTALDRFITEDDYLSQHRGELAEKNGARTPFVSFLDFRFLQDVGFVTGGSTHKLQLSIDIFNFANLLNSNWGVRYTNPFDYQLITFEGYDVDGTTPQFSFTDDDLGNDRFGISDRASRWRMRIGLRYIF